MQPRIKKYKVFSYFIFFILVVLSFSQKPVRAERTLILAVHPYLPHEDLIKKFTPMADYLSRMIGNSVKVRVGASYDEHIQYIGNNKVDIAYLGPASYIKMVNKFGDKPLLARLEVNGKPWFYGNIITRKDSGLTSLDSLKGKRIAYGDPNSTMSYLVPNYMLQKAKVFSDPATSYQFLNSHANVVLGVLSGDFDVGAVKPEVFKKYEAQGLLSIATTPKISEHLFVVRNNLPVKQITKLRSAMLSMSSSSDGLNALKIIKGSITGLVEVKSSDYENLSQIIIELNKIQ